MNGLIDKQKLMEDFSTVGCAFVYGGHLPGILSRIRQFSEEKAERVVYCHECKYRQEDRLFSTLWCGGYFAGKQVDPMDFCSKGEP